jgi:hypothetical protein
MQVKANVGYVGKKNPLTLRKLNLNVVANSTRIA